jgi:Flp pilus assembly protein TadB
VDLSALNEVRDRAAHRRNLAVRAVLLGALAAMAAVVSLRHVALAVTLAAVACAAVVVHHEVREARRRRELTGSMGRDWA